MLAEYLQHIRQQSDPRTEQDESDNIERRGPLFAVVRQMQINEDQTRDSNWNIKEENDAPLKIADDETSGDGSEHGRHQGWYRDKAHGAHKI